ncbi:MAG: hypothetical protein ACKVPJ_12955 [Chitinophagales bacterium]
MLLQIFDQSITQGPGTETYSSHSWEILLMLLGAFLLGYLLRFFLNLKMKRLIASLQDEVAKQNARISGLEGENSKLSTDFDNAVAKTIRLGSEVTLLTGRVKTADDANAKLTTENSQLGVDLSASNGKIKVLEDEILALKKKNMNLEDTAVKLNAESERQRDALKKLHADLDACLAAKK